MSTSGEKEAMEKAFNQAAGNLVWPMWTRSNYQEWASHIQCNLEAMYLWDAVSEDKVERRRDRLALGAMLHGVPTEMHAMLLNKKSMKDAWAAIKSMRLGADRVKAVNAQKLLAEFESITFKQGEAIEDFAMRITKLKTDLEGLGDKSVDDKRIVKKFLRVVPAMYNQVAVTIEMFCDLDTLTIEELIGRLRAAEDRFDPAVEKITEKTANLLMTEEEWSIKNKSRLISDSSSSSGQKKDGGRWVHKDKSGARNGDARDTGGRHPSTGTPKRKGRCNKCKIYGHYARECRTKMKEEKQGDTAHHAVGDVETGALLVAQVCSVVKAPSVSAQKVFLNQERVFPTEYHEGAWILDTGATNHMTGCREALVSLDKFVRGAVRFGDGSTVEIQGVGAVALTGKHDEHGVLTDVYFIPSLKCNIVSLGQLEEAGCRVEIDNGIMKVFEKRQAADRQQGVLIRAERKNRLYVLKVKLASPVCLLTKMDETAWLWHARYGHLNFRALQELGSKEMVVRLPRVRAVEQVCDGCALGKQHRSPFPRASPYRAKEALELVHADLCGQISPPTPGGKSYFLLVVDDMSRYMWLELQATKDEAFVCFKKIKAAAEMESGRRLKAFRTDCGGEFNSGVFVTFCNDNGIKHNRTTPYTPQQNGVVE